MNYTKLSFTIENEPSKATSDGLELNIDNGELLINLYYTANERPLCVKSTVKKGDRVEIRLLSYRIDLLVNGELMDEEWPAGECLYTTKNEITSDFAIDVTEGEYSEPEQPSVIGTFTNAEGWRPSENEFVGDCMAHVHDGRFHVMYLKDRHHHASKWGYGAHQWEHISTDDFANWQIHPTVVPIDDPSEGSICTGSWVERNGVQYVYYTVRGFNADTPAKICRSISQDGYHYKKDKDFGFYLSDKYHTPSERDPKIIADSNGVYHMLLTTSLLNKGGGCLAHLTSTDLDTWTEEEPIYRSWANTQPECPDYISFKGHRYMFYSLDTVAHYLYTDKEFTDWKIPGKQTIECGCVPKGAVWGDKIVFVGFNKIGNYAGTLTFKTATINSEHEIVFDEE